VAVRVVRGDRPGTLGIIGGMRGVPYQRTTSRKSLESGICWFCGVEGATNSLRLETGWERAACEACLVAHGQTTEDEAKARQVTDLRALLVELG
jgi:hypothetical protein